MSIVSEVAKKRFQKGDDSRRAELGHVFHLDMKSEQAHQCNQAQGEFFRTFL